MGEKKDAHLSGQHSLFSPDVFIFTGLYLFICPLLTKYR